MKTGDYLFLVDGSSYIFRAYHALPPLTRKSDGLPVGAVSGFCNMLWKLLQDARNTDMGVVPTHFAVIFDYSSKTFRHEIYPEYKATRTIPPEDLIPQFALIRQATKAFNIPCIEKEGYEADDLIATYARLATQAGGNVTIISSDKDLMQLVTDKVSIYDSMKDKQISIAEVIEKWNVPPEKMIDLQALTGDSTDNIPGIPGIGPKIAAQLLKEYGDLDTLLAQASKIKQEKRRENIITFAEQAKLSRKLVTLKTDIPIDINLNELMLEPQNGPKLIAFLKAMEFTTLTRRVAEATNTDAIEIEPAFIETQWNTDADRLGMESSTLVSILEENKMNFPKEKRTPSSLSTARAVAAIAEKIDVTHYICIRNLSLLEEWIKEAIETGFVSFDTETNSLDPMQADLVGFSLALAPSRAAYVPLQHKSGAGNLSGNELIENQIALDRALVVLKPMLEDRSVLKIAQNMKYDWLLMHRYGIDIVPFDDTMLISYVLDAGISRHNLDMLAQRWLGHKTISYKDVAGSGKSAIPFDRVDLERATAYAAEDADVTLRLWRVLKPRLIAQGLVSVYERLERPLVPVLARMEECGVSIDQKILLQLSENLAQAAAVLEYEIYHLAGERFTIGSPKQLGKILFSKLGLLGDAKTKTGQWSTSVQILEDLAADGHELPRKIIDWRQLTKLKSTYTDALPGYINPRTKRIHTSFALASTSTGRLSSSEPNLQNIPIRTIEGRKIRTAFIAKPGNKLISADYSQIELRLLAHIADIPQLKQSFADGIDIHAMTASEIFNVPIKNMPDEIRRRAKAINFGIIYGISAFGLANQLSISREEAGQYIRTYFERFPAIRDYMEATKIFAREHGYVETIFGRRAHYPDIRSSNAQVRTFNERAAINAPIQGSAADIIRRAMIRMEDALITQKLSAQMLLQVHDELIFEAPEDEIEMTIPVVRSVMENAAMPAISLSVPLQVDVRAAQNWDEAH